MSDTDTSSTTSSEHCEPKPTLNEASGPIVNLPPDLAEKIIWSFPRNNKAHPSDVSSTPAGTTIPPRDLPLFPDGVVNEVQNAVAYAFSHSSQTSGDKSQRSLKVPANPNISLYYPHDLCNEIVDAMVKLIARSQDADVLVIDSLELAAGKHGIFGKEIKHTLDMIYDREGHNETRINATLSAVVNLERQDVSGTPSTRRRIVYMRDFGAVIQTARPLMTYLLEAIQARRTSNTTSESTESSKASYLPTVLIMGFSQAPTATNDKKAMCQAFSTGGKALRATLPPVGGKLYIYSEDYEFKSKASPRTKKMNDLITGMFNNTLSSYERSVAKEKLKDRLDTKEDGFPKIQSNAACLPIFVKDAYIPELQDLKDSWSRDRKIRIWNHWITMYMERIGALTCEEPLSSMYGEDTPSVSGSVTPSMCIESLQKLSKRAAVPVLDVVEHVLSSALKLCMTEVNDGSPSPSPLFVSSSHLGRAYRSYLNTLEERSSWASAEEENLGLTLEPDLDSEEQNDKGSVDPVLRRVRQLELDKHESRLINNVVDLRSLSDISFDDVCIPPHVIESLRTIVSLPLLHPLAFKRGVLRHEGIGGVLLYGPPGTGKTMVCRALAKECQARMLQVKPSDVMQKYVGETEKMVRAIFNLAYRLAPCVIFIDEIDALFRTRGSGDAHWRRDMLNEFMESMDGLQSAKKNKEAGIVVIGATNRPYDLDDAIIRRLPTRMMVDLPGLAERERILRVHLTGEILHQDLDVRNLAQRAINYSGSDLRNLCVSAAMASVKGMLGDINWERRPQEAGKSGRAPDNLDWSTRVVDASHFEHAFTEVLASTAEGNHSELHAWHKRYGGFSKTVKDPKNEN